MKNLEKENLKLKKALSDLVNMYVSNQGSKYEFICCVTPPSNSEMTLQERRKNKVWKNWDRAISLLT